jgi:hypothetical protein
MSDLDRHPLSRLDEDDLTMICSFVLLSGSIKDLAREYGVSYPTMRQRLDQLIERVQRAVDGQPNDPLNDYLADEIARGRLTGDMAQRIRELHRRALQPGPNPTADGEDRHG